MVIRGLVKLKKNPLKNAIRWVGQDIFSTIMPISLCLSHKLSQTPGYIILCIYLVIKNILCVI